MRYAAIAAPVCRKRPTGIRCGSCSLVCTETVSDRSPSRIPWAGERPAKQPGPMAQKGAHMMKTWVMLTLAGMLAGPGSVSLALAEPNEHAADGQARAAEGKARAEANK